MYPGAVGQLPDTARPVRHAGIGDRLGLPPRWPYASISPSQAPAGR